MTLGIISDCIHIRHGRSPVGSHVHVFVRQMDHLSTYFDRVYVCAPVINEHHNESPISVYENGNVEFLPIPLGGGNTLFSKLKIAVILPVWIYQLIQVCRKADVLYLRAPNNISIPGFVVSWFFKKPRFSTFTGTWSGYRTEPFTYKLQRKYLSKYFEGPVFVYGRLSTDRANIHDTISPSYSLDDWHQETAQVERRLKLLAEQKPIERCINLITVGSLTDNKNQMFILQAMTKLKLLRVTFMLWVAGDGERLDTYRNFVHENGLRENVVFLGHVQQSKLRDYYRKADFVVQAPIHEGYGKVPIEGFFHGVVPVLRDVNLARSIVGGNQRGRVFGNQDELVAHLYSFIVDAGLMAEAIKNGRAYARENSLESWGRQLFDRAMDRKG